MRALNTWGPLTLRLTGVACLVLLLWNPAIAHRAAPGAAPVVLLDASLSMGGLWSEALDTARASARGGVILRFGRTVASFDTTPPTDGASRLAPALTAAAARGGPIVIVTDGAIEDRDALPSDVIARSRVVVLGNAAPPDAFVSAVEGPHQVGPGDTVSLRVTYGKAGKREAGSGKSDATLVVSLGGKMLASRKVALPDSGTVEASFALPASRFPSPGWSSLAVGIQWSGDSEPRDDSRAFPIEVTSEPAAVVLGAPPDWDATFLARALGDVARVPVRYFTQITAGRWNEGVTLAPVSAERVQRALRGARLVVLVGDPSRWPRVSAPALLTWNSAGGSAGDWYLAPAPGSPLAGALAAVPWDSVPPVLAALPSPADSGATPILEGTRSRRGQPQAVVLVRQNARGGGRRAGVNLSGLYRWDFRGGVSQQAYRATIAALVDWLLAGGSPAGDWAHPDSLDFPAGLPVTWRWSGPGGGAPRPIGVVFTATTGTRNDTLQFGADGRAEVSLAPGTYRYQLADGHGRGLVVVDQYSDEWRRTPVLLDQPGRAAAERVVTDWRERWWLFALAIAAFAAEWAWRRRMGLA